MSGNEKLLRWIQSISSGPAIQPLAMAIDSLRVEQPFFGISVYAAFEPKIDTVR